MELTTKAGAIASSCSRAAPFEDPDFPPVYNSLGGKFYDVTPVGPITNSPTFPYITFSNDQNTICTAAYGISRHSDLDFTRKTEIALFVLSSVSLLLLLSLLLPLCFFFRLLTSILTPYCCCGLFFLANVAANYIGFERAFTRAQADWRRPLELTEAPTLIHDKKTIPSLVQGTTWPRFHP